MTAHFTCYFFFFNFWLAGSFFFPEEYHSRVLDDLELATYDVKIFTTPHPRIFGLGGFFYAISLIYLIW